LKRPHHICVCGYYDGREIFKAKAA